MCAVVVRVFVQGCHIFVYVSVTSSLLFCFSGWGRWTWGEEPNQRSSAPPLWFMEGT